MEMRNYLRNVLRPGQKYAVLGIGSVQRSDDAAGMYFIELLSGLTKRDDFLLIAGSTAPENFTGVIKDFSPDVLFVVDAAHMGLLPGDVKVLPACDIGGVTFSTHMLPLNVMLEYLQSESSCDLVFIGIQPQSTDYGFSMCDDVKKSVEQLAGDFCFALAGPQADHSFAGSDRKSGELG
jgi:hydrogenase 3 maturation protease